MNNLKKSLEIIFSFQKECADLSPEDEEAYFEAILKMSRYMSIVSEQNQFTFDEETVDLLQIIFSTYISFIIEFYVIEENENYVEQLFTLLSILSDIIEKKVPVSYRSKLVESIGHKLFKFLNDVNYHAPINEIVKYFNELLARVKHKCKSQDFISDLCKLMKYLSICGDYEQQEVCIELIIRIFPEVNEIESAKLFFPESLNLATALTAIHKKTFIADARVFLNILNNFYESVISLRSNEIYLKNRRLFPNKSVSDLWVDINFGSSSIGIYCSSNCLLMNPNGDDEDFVELIRVREENIESIGEFINKTGETTSWQIVIKLSSPVTTCLESSEEFANTAKFLKIMFEEIPSVSNLQGYFSNLFPKKYNRKSSITSIETGMINNNKNIQSDSEGSEEIVEDLGGLNSENENDAESNNSSYEINDSNKTENGKNVLSSGKFQLKSLANLGKIENTSSRNRAPTSKDSRMSPTESVTLSYMDSNKIQYLQMNRNSSIISFQTGTNLSKERNASSTKRESTSKDFRTSPSESVALSYMDSNKIQHLQNNRNSSIISFEPGTNLSKERNASSKKRASTSKDSRTSPSESVALSYIDSNKIQHLQKNRNSSIISFETGTNLSKERNASSTNRASTSKDSRTNSFDIIALSYMDLNKIQQLPKNRRSSSIIGIKTDTINNIQRDSEGSEEIVAVLDARDNGSNIENVNNDAESNFSHEINDTNETQNRKNVLISGKFQLKFINDEKVGSDHDYDVRSPENDHQDSTEPSRANNVGERNHSGSITSGIFDFRSKVNEIDDNNFVQSLDSILSETLTKEVDNESDIHKQVDNSVANDNRKGKQKIGNRRKLDKKAFARKPNLKKIQKQRTNENKKVRKSKKPNTNSGIRDNLFSHSDQSEDKKICTDDNTRNKAKLSLNKHLSNLSCISNEVSQKKLNSTSILDTWDNDLSSKNDNETVESKSYLASINEEIVISDHDVFIPSQENDLNSIDFSMISNVRGGNHAEASTTKVENENSIHEQVDNIIANDNPKGKQKIGYKRVLAKKFNAKEPKLKKIQKQSIKKIDENKKVRISKKPNANSGLQDNLFLHPNKSKYKKVCTDDKARNETKLSLSKHFSALRCITNEVSQEKLDSTKILETTRENDLNSKNNNESAETTSNNDEIIISTHTQENDQNTIVFPMININRDYAGRINNGIQEKRKKPNINKLQLLDFPSNKRAPKEFILNKENCAKTSANSSKRVENDCNIRGILLERVDNIIVDPKTEHKIGKKRNLDKKSKVEVPKMKKIKKQCNNEVEEKNKVIESKQPNIYSGIQSTLLLPKNKEINTNNAENETDVNLVSHKKKDSTSVSDESFPKTGFCRKSETLLAAFPKWSDVPRTIAEQIEYFKNIKREKETKLIIDDGFLFFAANRRAVNEYIKEMARADEIIREGKRKLREAREELREYFKTSEGKKTS